MEISGAVKIEKLVNNDKQFILVSDIHTSFDKKGCKSFFSKIKYVPEFLYELITQDKTLQWDFYLEQGIQTSSGIPDSNFLEGLQTYYLDEYHDNPKLQELDLYLDMMESKKGSLLYLVKHYFNARGCFLYNQCKIDNSKFHFIDVRQKNLGDCFLRNVILFTRFFRTLHMYLSLVKEWRYEEIDIILDDFIEDLLDAFNEVSKCKLNRVINKQINKSVLTEEIHTFFKKINNSLEDILMDIYNIWYNNKQIIKDLMIEDLVKYKNLESCDFKFLNLKKFLKNQYNKKKTIQKIIKFDSRYETNVFNHKLEIPLISTVCVILISNLMDMYTIGRITKNYNKNVIIVAGINHINTYRDFLLKNNWKIEWSSKQISEKCSKIPNNKKTKKKVKTKL